MARPKGRKKINPIVGQRIKDARKNMGSEWTQEKLANEIGVSVTSIRNWEQGRFEPTVDYLEAISKSCNVGLEWLQGLDVPTIIKDSQGIWENFNKHHEQWQNVAPMLTESTRKWAESFYPIMLNILTYYGYPHDFLNNSHDFYNFSDFMESEIRHSIETYIKIFNKSEKEKTK